MARYSKGCLRTVKATVVLALIGSGGPLHAVEVVSEPVGFITLAVTGGSSAGHFSFLGLGLTPLVAARGRLSGVTGATLTDASAMWTNNQFNGVGNAHYLEVTSGPGAGVTDDIVATDGAGHSLTTANNLSSLIQPGETTYRIRKHWTLSSVFGTSNETGFQTGPSASQADNILVYHPLAGEWVTYYFQTGAGWRASTNASLDVSATVLYGDQGIVVKRQPAALLAVKLVGAVKLGPTSIPVDQGVTVVGNVYPITNLTLAVSGLYTGSAGTGLADDHSAAAADNVLLWNDAGYTTYYYRSGAGWRAATNAVLDVGNTPLPQGGSLIIKRKAPRPAFDWIIPQ